jgi:DNA-directed RNA polymerase specialized sigma24 family protein
MRRTGRQVVWNRRTARRQSAEQNNARVFHRVLDHNAEELLWLAEVLAGSRPAGEECLAEAIALAEETQYVGTEWMLSWAKRMLVHTALKRISGNIRQLLFPAEARNAVPLGRAGTSAFDQQRLRFISPSRIIASFDVLERACFILYGYLDYPVLDCALLLECPRAWIETICGRVSTKVAVISRSNQDGFQEIDFFVSPEVTECAG